MEDYNKEMDCFDEETNRLIFNNKEGKNTEIIIERTRIRAIKTYEHNLSIYWKHNPFGNELFFCKSWIQLEKENRELEKVMVYYGATTGQKKDNLFLLTINGEKKLVQPVDDSDIAFLRKTDDFSILVRKEFFQGVAYLKYIEERHEILTNPKNNLIEQTEPLDLSDHKAVEKIIYLKELGIIKTLQKEPCFMSSINNLATVLSAITGEKSGTLQPILNSMLNENTAQKNNPYKSKLTVEKVKTQLINLGIQPK